MTPTTSPGNASSSTTRSSPKTSCACASVNGRPVREFVTFMPRSKRPDETRRNATRSRWRGSMFAWTLKTRPENGASIARGAPSASRRACGDGARRSSASSSRPTPKFDTAEPKKTGVAWPSAKSAGSSVPPAPSSSSSSSAATVHDSPSRAAACSGLHELLGRALGAARGPREAMKRAGRAVDDAAKVARDADRPRRRDRMQAEHLLDVVDHVERVEARPVVLVDERDQRDVARPRDLEQAQRLRLDALRGVEQHDRAVGGREHAQRVLGEVLVARGVEQVEDRVGVLEAQHGRGHRDAAAALDVHPVRGRGAARAAALDRAGDVDRVAVEQQLLGQRRLAGVRVGDDRERPPAGGLGRDHATRRGGGCGGHRRAQTGVVKGVRGRSLGGAPALLRGMSARAMVHVRVAVGSRLDALAPAVSLHVARGARAARVAARRVRRLRRRQRRRRG